MTAADVNNITPKASATSSLELGMANGLEGNRFWGSSNMMGLKVKNCLLASKHCQRYSKSVSHDFRQ